MSNQCNKGVVGNSIDIGINCQDTSAEIRADIRVDEIGGKRIWGQIINCKDEPIPNCLVKLARITEKGGKQSYEGIAHTVTDCEGFYQFDVCEEDVCYKIIVNKAVTGPEKIIETGGGNCHACESGNKCNPCEKQSCIIAPYNPCSCKKCDKSCAVQKPKCNYASYTR